MTGPTAETPPQRCGLRSVRPEVPSWPVGEGAELRALVVACPSGSSSSSAVESRDAASRDPMPPSTCVIRAG
ncbi:MAG TPA: hypothetical protein VFI44_11800, partial [Ornithinibacter sp.]|nr:hypothetical protein [Ornithinibacter sp.]